MLSPRLGLVEPELELGPLRVVPEVAGLSLCSLICSICLAISRILAARALFDLLVNNLAAGLC